MPFAKFMELALYHPAVGYYQAHRPRVGYGANSDFFTSSTSGPLFGKLIVASCLKLLGEHSAQDFTFVEIGAENPKGILDGVDHPFGQTRVLQLGEPLDLAGRCIVFSNELFDAQPFRRFISRQSKWRERGVALREGKLEEVELTTSAIDRFRAPIHDDYIFDAPEAAAALANMLAAQSWEGLFLACDYGKTERELLEELPAGTARAYYRHQQSNDLLARPGEQDLTCHVCWDWLSAALANHGFHAPVVESQEAFFIRHAADFIAKTSSAEAGRFSRDKLSLLQLLHPSHLGQKFQVLHAWREGNAVP